MTAAAFDLVAPAVVGDAATMPGLVKRFVLTRCELPETVMLGCFSCRQPLASLTQLQWHLEDRPQQTHVLARLCPEHGWETL